MPTTAKATPTATSEPAVTRGSLKDPTTIVKAYFSAVSKVLSAQESLVLRAVEKAPKGIDLRSIGRRSTATK